MLGPRAATELERGVVQLKDFNGGEQTEIARDTAAEHVARLLRERA